MPEKNAIKEYLNQTYYHVYNRGINKQDVFITDNDYELFISLLKRYLSPKVHRDEKGRKYPNFYQSIDLIAYCLMPNHYHMLVYVRDKPMDLAKAMSSHQVAFVSNYNKIHNRVGHLFQGRYKARVIECDADLQNIFDYIHKNPGKEYSSYEYSSYKYYTSDMHIIPRTVLGK